MLFDLRYYVLVLPARGSAECAAVFKANKVQKFKVQSSKLIFTNFVHSALNSNIFNSCWLLLHPAIQIWGVEPPHFGDLNNINPHRRKIVFSYLMRNQPITAWVTRQAGRDCQDDDWKIWCHAQTWRKRVFHMFLNTSSWWYMSLIVWNFLSPIVWGRFFCGYRISG